MRRASAAALTVLLAIGCGSQPTTPSPTSGPISSVASNYLNELLAIMQANSMNRLSIDWTGGPILPDETISDPTAAMQRAVASAPNAAATKTNCFWR